MGLSRTSATIINHPNPRPILSYSSAVFSCENTGSGGRGGGGVWKVSKIFTNVNRVDENKLGHKIWGYCDRQCLFCASARHVPRLRPLFTAYKQLHCYYASSRINTLKLLNRLTLYYGGWVPLPYRSLNWF